MKNQNQPYLCQLLGIELNVPFRHPAVKGDVVAKEKDGIVRFYHPSTDIPLHSVIYEPILRHPERIQHIPQNTGDKMSGLCMLLGVKLRQPFTAKNLPGKTFSVILNVYGEQAVAQRNGMVNEVIPFPMELFQEEGNVQPCGPVQWTPEELTLLKSLGEKGIIWLYRDYGSDIVEYKGYDGGRNVSGTMPAGLLLPSCPCGYRIDLGKHGYIPPEELVPVQTPDAKDTQADASAAEKTTISAKSEPQPKKAGAPAEEKKVVSPADKLAKSKAQAESVFTDALIARREVSTVFEWVPFHEFQFHVWQAMGLLMDKDVRIDGHKNLFLWSSPDIRMDVKRLLGAARNLLQQRAVYQSNLDDTSIIQILSSAVAKVKKWERELDERLTMGRWVLTDARKDTTRKTLCFRTNLNNLKGCLSGEKDSYSIRDLTMWAQKVLGEHPRTAGYTYTDMETRILCLEVLDYKGKAPDTTLLADRIDGILGSALNLLYRDDADLDPFWNRETAQYFIRLMESEKKFLLDGKPASRDLRQAARLLLVTHESARDHLFPIELGEKEMDEACRKLAKTLPTLQKSETPEKTEAPTEELQKRLQTTADAKAVLWSALATECCICPSSTWYDIQTFRRLVWQAKDFFLAENTTLFGPLLLLGGDLDISFDARPLFKEARRILHEMGRIEREFSDKELFSLIVLAVQKVEDQKTAPLEPRLSMARDVLTKALHDSNRTMFQTTMNDLKDAMPKTDPNLDALAVTAEMVLRSDSYTAGETYGLTEVLLLCMDIAIKELDATPGYFESKECDGFLCWNLAALKTAAGWEGYDSPQPWAEVLKKRFRMMLAEEKENILAGISASDMLMMTTRLLLTTQRMYEANLYQYGDITRAELNTLLLRLVSEE